MNYGNIHSWSINLDRRIALALRRNPKLSESLSIVSDRKWLPQGPPLLRATMSGSGNVILTL
jgi:hypothetical protein